MGPERWSQLVRELVVGLEQEQQRVLALVEAPDAV
jgi:hypothetical protein